MPTPLTDPRLEERLARIRLIVTDVDGVLTDGTAWYSDQGLAMKRFSMRDGFGFTLARFAGIQLAALTGNVAELVRRRLEPFGVTRIKGGHFRKTEFFREILEETGVPAGECLYVGDDLFDVPVLEIAGVGIAPADAHPDVLEAADGVTAARGGEGVVREVVEGILRVTGTMEDVLQKIQRDKKGGRL